MVNFCQGSGHKVQGEAKEGKHSQEMGPNISRFCMNSEYGCEALSKARQGGTVTLLEEIIILKHFCSEDNFHPHEIQITY